LRSSSSSSSSSAFNFASRCVVMSLPGQLAAGTCEIVTLDRDSSQPRRTIARQTARCACKKGQIAGTTRARPACVDAAIVRKRQWCEMFPCLEDEGCDLLVNRSGWTCTQPGGRVKTTTTLLQQHNSPETAERHGDPLTDKTALNLLLTTSSSSTSTIAVTTIDVDQMMRSEPMMAAAMVRGGP
ncbi:hypothetical protein CRUP_034726, partial [Coryphaenoides rupestris]